MEYVKIYVCHQLKRSKRAVKPVFSPQERTFEVTYGKITISR